MAAQYPIFDISPNTINGQELIYFVRYQTTPQGNQIYYGLGVEGGLPRIVHEVCGVEGMNGGLTPMTNVYDEWRAGKIFFPWIADYPNNYRQRKSEPEWYIENLP